MDQENRWRHQSANMSVSLLSNPNFIMIVELVYNTNKSIRVYSILPKWSMIVTDSKPVIELCESETSARIADVKSSSCILEFFRLWRIEEISVKLNNSNGNLISKSEENLQSKKFVWLLHQYFHYRQLVDQILNFDKTGFELENVRK